MKPYGFLDALAEASVAAYFGCFIWFMFVTSMHGRLI